MMLLVASLLVKLQLYYIPGPQFPWMAVVCFSVVLCFFYQAGTTAIFSLDTSHIIKTTQNIFVGLGFVHKSTS